MKKIRRWTALMLTAVLLFTPRLAVFAECWHDGTPTEFDYRRLSDAEGDIDTYAKCSQCGEWYLYCTAHPSATSPAPEHSWEMVDVSMTTCTADGWYKIRCSHCGAEQVTVTDKAYGHRFGEWTMTKAPTCEADGVRERVCEECYQKETQAIPATGHAFGDWAMTKAPTCEADGVRTRTCSTCGKTETSGVPATGHAYSEWVLTTPPTCEADGVRTRTCSRCGKTETSGVPATGHAFGDWVSVKPATSTQPGVEERTCAHCGQKETRETAIDTAVLGVGDTGIKVVILEELLRAGGEFAGEADEEYTDETAAAVNAYRKACGLPETGLADAELLARLTGRYVTSFGGAFPGDGYLGWFDSGLKPFPIWESTSTGNGDGTHESTKTLLGIRYRLGGELCEIPVPEADRVTVTVTEPCETGNDQMTCPHCGYRETLQTAYVLAADILAVCGGSLTLRFPQDPGLPSITGLTYDEGIDAVVFTPPDGTNFYQVVLKRMDEATKKFEEVNRFQVRGAFSMEEYPQGRYSVEVTAIGSSYQELSQTAMVVFDKQGAKMYPVWALHIDGPLVHWEYPYPSVSWVPVKYHVGVFFNNMGDAGHYVFEITTTDRYVDLTALIVDRDVDIRNRYITVAVTAMTDAGNIADADPVTETIRFGALGFYRAGTSVNVRSGPGRDYDRVGGLSRGDIVIGGETATTDDGVFRRIWYKDLGNAWVLDSCLSSFTVKKYTVNVDMSFGPDPDRPYERIMTEIDGTLDWNKLRSMCLRPGYLISGLTARGQQVDEDFVYEKGEIVFIDWERDPAWHIVHFYGLDGKPVRIYSECEEDYVTDVPIETGGRAELPFRDENGELIRWTTKPGGQGTVVTASTPVTADITELYAEKLTGKDILFGDSIAYLPDSIRGLKEEPTRTGKRIALLEPGDRVRIDDLRVSVEAGHGEFRYYHVYVSRLDMSGWVRVELLDGLDGQKTSFTVTFDAAGGYCPVYTMQARYLPGYAYATIAQYPVPVRDGYVFVGWKDADGTYYYPGTEVRLDVRLKAEWLDGTGYPRKYGVTVYRKDNISDSYPAQPFCKETPPGVRGARTSVPVGVEMLIVGEAGNWYLCVMDGRQVWINKSYITTEYARAYAGGSKGLYETRKLGGEYADLARGTPFFVLGTYKGNRHVVVDPATNPSSWQGWELPGEGWLAPGGVIDVDRVYFDAGRGHCSLEYTELVLGYPQQIPIAYCAGHEFLGWFTDPVAGQLVNLGVKVNGSITVYARYKNLDDDIYVVTDQTHLLDHPRKDAEELKFFRPGRALISEGDVIGDTGYIRTRPDGVLGFVAHDSLVEGSWMMVGYDPKYDRCVRSRPKKGKGFIRDIVPGEVFIIIGEEGSYYCVAFPESENGFAYVHKRQFNQ